MQVTYIHLLIFLSFDLDIGRQSVFIGEVCLYVKVFLLARCACTSKCFYWRGVHVQYATVHILIKGYESNG